MAWYDYVPFFGAVGAAQERPDTRQMDEDRAAAEQMYKMFLRERRDIAPNAPQIEAERMAGQSVDAPTMDARYVESLRARQVGGLNALEAAARGEVPSAAQMAFAGQQQDIASQQMGLAAQARGTAGVFARREAMANIAAQQRRAAADNAMMRAQEMAAARGQYAGMLSDVRGADAAWAVERARQQLAAGTTTAQLQQDAAARNQSAFLEAAARNQGATLQSQQIANQLRLGLGEQALGAQQSAQASTAQRFQAQEQHRQRRIQSNAAMTNALATMGTGYLTSMPTGQPGQQRGSDYRYPNPF
jgi:hypothetical protein